MLYLFLNKNNLCLSYFFKMSLRMISFLLIFSALFFMPVFLCTSITYLYTLYWFVSLCMSDICIGLNNFLLYIIFSFFLNCPYSVFFSPSIRCFHYLPFHPSLSYSSPSSECVFLSAMSVPPPFDYCLA